MHSPDETVYTGIERTEALCWIALMLLTKAFTSAQADIKERLNA